MATNAVSLNIPPFCPTDPLLWFPCSPRLRQFATQNITVSKTKFDHVIAALSPKYVTEVRDLILSPPLDEPFKASKDPWFREQQHQNNDVYSNSSMSSYRRQAGFGVFSSLTAILLTHSSPLSNSDLCWYHQKFRETAKKCKPLFTWMGNKQASH